jgi:hypothetical protein
MTEAAPKVNPEVNPAGPIAQLLALIGEGDGVGITKLTLEMIREIEE